MVSDLQKKKTLSYGRHVGLLFDWMKNNEENKVVK
jgi:hypothetical protein